MLVNRPDECIIWVFNTVLAFNVPRRTRVASCAVLNMHEGIKSRSRELMSSPFEPFATRIGEPPDSSPPDEPTSCELAVLMSTDIGLDAATQRCYFIRNDVFAIVKAEGAGMSARGFAVGNPHVAQKGDRFANRRPLNGYKHP